MGCRSDSYRLKSRSYIWEKFKRVLESMEISESRDRWRRGCRIRLSWDRLTQKRVQPRIRMRENRMSGLCVAPGSRPFYHDESSYQEYVITSNLIFFG